MAVERNSNENPSIRRAHLDPIEPSVSGNGTKPKEVFQKPNARYLPMHPKPAANAETVRLAISVPDAGLPWVYQILINTFLRDSDKGGKHG